MFGLFKKKAKAERCYDVTRIQYELVVMSSKLIKKQTDMFKVIKGGARGGFRRPFIISRVYNAMGHWILHWSPGCSDSDGG